MNFICWIKHQSLSSVHVWRNQGGDKRLSDVDTGRGSWSSSEGGSVVETGEVAADGAQQQ